MIWEAYTIWAKGVDPETAIQVYKRYAKMKPDILEDLIEYLLSRDQVEEVIPIFEELHKTTPKTHEIAELISKFPEKCHKMLGNPVDFLRNAIKTSENKGLFWTFLAEFFIR